MLLAFKVLNLNNLFAYTILIKGLSVTWMMEFHLHGHKHDFFKLLNLTFLKFRASNRFIVYK